MIADSVGLEQGLGRSIPTPYHHVVHEVDQEALATERRDNGDGTKTIVAHAEDVHEFAWVADAQFREATGAWRDPETGRSVAIRLLYQPDHDDVVDKYIGSTKSTLEYVHRWLG